jgi:hypothetical protein
MVFAVSLVLALSPVVAWLVILPRDPLFHGKPESYWIQHLTYRDDEQARQWREFGPDGVRVLVRGLEGADRPADQVYRHLYRSMMSFLPGSWIRLLPAPRMDLTRGTRMTVADVLSRMGRDAMLAAPAMTRALKDEDPAVRQIAITFFTAGEDDNAPLNHMDAETKKDLLKIFILFMQDSHEGVRNNTVVALRYYPEQAQTVDPVLIKALQDPSPQIRRLAADALKRIDPAAAAKSGVR